MKARVYNGRLKLDEPTDLPDGTEVELVAIPSAEADKDELSDTDRARLHQALAASDQDILAKRVRPAADVIAEIAGAATSR